MSASSLADQDRNSGRAAFARLHHPSILGKLALAIVGVFFAGYLISRAFDAWWPSADIHSLLRGVNLGLSSAGLPVLALWLIGLPVTEYCGLVRPRGRDVVIGVACTAAFQLTEFGLLLLLGVKFSAGAGFAPWFVLRDAVMAVTFFPITEEILYRGFAYRGLAQSRLGIVGAIVVTSLAWSLIYLDPIHLDKGPPPIIIPFIFLLGLLFGWLRQRSGSTVLTILLHAQFNLTSSLFFAALALGWLSLS
jgi:membrane protease YdiL (CAAX protease family)